MYSLSLMPDEPDQVPRLDAFRAAHPGVVIGADEFGVWQGRIPGPYGEMVVNRYTLRALLDRLGELLGDEQS